MKSNRLTTRKGETIAFTELGFGGGPLGNMYAPLREEEAQATLDAAYEAGIRYFDTAPLYGLGLSETRFGQAFARFGRAGTVLASKVGRVLREPKDAADDPSGIFVDVPRRSYDFDYSYDGVMRAYEQSLTRMGVARIDVLYIHDVDSWAHGSREGAEARLAEVMGTGFRGERKAGYRALAELRDAGDVSAIGAGVNDWEICDWLMRRGDFDLFLLAGRYSLLEQKAQETFLPECTERGVGVVLGGPFNSGILATGAVKNARYNYAPAPEDILDRVRGIEAICREHVVALPHAALRFALAHPAIVSVIPGARTPEEVGRNVEALSADIPDALWTALKEHGYLREDAPVPGNENGA